jgi:hypothetical protein
MKGSSAEGGAAPSAIKGLYLVGHHHPFLSGASYSDSVG